MKSLIINLILLLSIFSCSTSRHYKPEERIENVSSPPVEISPEQSVVLDITILKPFSSAHLAKIESAKEKCNFIINEKDFKNNFYKIELNPTDNNGKNHTEILQELLSGKDIYETLPDKIINLYLKPYKTANPWSSVKGYTTKGDKVIYENIRKFSSHTDCSMCAHFIHEYLHNLGYSHPVKSRWNTTVPYAVGDYVYEVCKEKENE